MARVGYTGGSYEDLPNGFNVVNIKMGACNTYNDDKNKNNHDVNWYFVLSDVDEPSKSSMYSITQNFKWEGDKIDPSSFLLTKLNHLMDAVGYAGGFNIDGKFEDPNGVIIGQEEGVKQIVELGLNNKICVFKYDEKYSGKNAAHKGKVFSQIFHQIFESSQIAKLEKSVADSIKSGFLKMIDTTPAPQQTSVGRGFKI